MYVHVHVQVYVYMYVYVYVNSYAYAYAYVHASVYVYAYVYMCMQGTPVRIIAVASSAHQMDGLDLDDLHFKKRKYTPWKAYGQSKLCNVLYAKELARR